MTLTARNTPAAAPCTPFEEELVHMFDDVDAMIETLENPTHRRILINYRRHGLLEVSGRYDELLADTMTIGHPHYRIFEGGQPVILDGLESVRGFYRTLAEMDMLVMWTGRQKMAVADWGFAGEAEFSQFVPGSMLGDNVFASLGEQGPSDGPAAHDPAAYDPDAYYLVRRTLAFVWPYNDHVRMIGEHVYEDSASKSVTKVERSDVITGARAAELLAPLIDKYGLDG
ncbi:hypothetical protein [Gordonia polyisoprenivorans]|uniref:hypothetical protein n=1 Tax=Gordonia polyisoprenivorans TaxID=84595 RepID=UPI001AD6B07B|nr:hypothetical protein [Gordonia polyisoprenivorans]QTI68628.1 hypothetical protein J6U32_24705 [Gordonia polyisoprenivorans]